MNKLMTLIKQSSKLKITFLANTLLSLHYYLIIYINSSYLNRYFSESQVSVLYIIAACVTTFLLLNISRIIEKLGNYKAILYAIFFDIMALVGIIVTTNPFLVGLYFIILDISIPIIWFNLDIFLENASTDESETGEIRGTYLTLSNATLVVAPAVVSFLLRANHFGYVYSFSLLFIIPLFFLIRKYERGFVDKPSHHIRIKETIREYLKNKKLFNVFVVYFLLQLFFAFMVVYTPIYLERNIGFPWSETGIIFTIMLLPFVLFELPIGHLADEKYGEKEFMTIGLIVIGLSTMFISFITVPSFLVWAFVLFLTRTGASFVEITVDSYFFKQVDEEKPELISVYRLARPLSFIITPIIITLLLNFISIQYTFLVIGIIMILGTKYSISLIDTK